MTARCDHYGETGHRINVWGNCTGAACDYSTPDSTHSGDPEPRCARPVPALDGPDIPCGLPEDNPRHIEAFVSYDHPFQPAPATEACVGWPECKETHYAAPAVTGEACGHEFPVIPGQHLADAICKKCGLSRREARKVEREAAPAATGERVVDPCHPNDTTTSLLEAGLRIFIGRDAMTTHWRERVALILAAPAAETGDEGEIEEWRIETTARPVIG